MFLPLGDNNSKIFNRNFFIFAGVLICTVVLIGAGFLIWERYSDFVLEEKESKLFFAQLADSTGSLLNKVSGNVSGNDLKLAAEVKLEDKKNENVSDELDNNPNILNQIDLASAVITSDNTKDNSVDFLYQEPASAQEPQVLSSQTSNIDQLSYSSAPATAQEIVASEQCVYNSSQISKPENLIFNEIAWMGSPNSANDEWIELKNLSSQELDISGWQILDKDEQIKIIFKNGIKVAGSGFLLLERTNDDSLPGIAADLIYSGALSNTDEGVRIFNKNCILADEAVASLDWLAGENESRKTMERSSDLSWHTYNGNGENFNGTVIMGTPKKENSFAAISETNSGLSGDANYASPIASTTSVSAGVSHPVISEVRITGGSGQTTNDFIELYNPTNQPFNLKSYRLVKRTKTGTSDTSIKSWISDAFIPAYGFYLWANSNYGGIGVAPDAVTAGSIADDSGVALRFGAEDTGEIIDSISWGQAENIFSEGQKFSLNPAANQSIERMAWNNGCISAQGTGESAGNGCDTGNNANDFEIRSLSNPQNSNSSPEPQN